MILTKELAAILRKEFCAPVIQAERLMWTDVFVGHELPLESRDETTPLSPPAFILETHGLTFP